MALSGIETVPPDILKESPYVLILGELSLLDDFEAEDEELVEVDEIGDKIAESVISYFSQDKNRVLIENLKTKIH